MIVTRFAPSPTGLLHLGHAFAALTAFQTAREKSGRFLLRIEDIDVTRCRREFETAIYEDLRWLGLVWEEPVRRQSAHFTDYENALRKLDAMGVLYTCFCTRKDIADEIAGASAAPHLILQGPEGPLYPGTCRNLSAEERNIRMARGERYALRLDVGRAHESTGILTFVEEGRGPEGEHGLQTVEATCLGDVVLARKEMPASYHLAVVNDDALQGVTCITRGEDLFHATHVQRLLQALLGFPQPVYAHHRLLTDETGKKFSKRDKAVTLAKLRANGATPNDIKRRIGLAA